MRLRFHYLLVWILLASVWRAPAFGQSSETDFGRYLFDFAPHWHESDFSAGSDNTDANDLLDLLGDCISDNAEVEFPDGGLEAAVRAALQRPTGPLTTCEMKRLIGLEANNLGITNLEGLGYATQLKYLQMRGNRFQDLWALSGCRELIFIDLSGNESFSDYASIVPLRNLEVVFLLRMESPNLEPLSRLPNLFDVVLVDSKGVDLGQLAGAPSLRALNVSGCDFIDPEGISELVGLTNLSFNRVYPDDIERLGTLTNLTHLELLQNSIRDIGPLAGLTKLVELDLSYNLVSDLSPLANMADLEELRIEHNSRLASLNPFTIEYTISDISPLANNSKLKRLRAGENAITDLSPVANLDAFEFLDFGNNRISDLSALVENNSFGMNSDSWLDVRSNPLGNQAQCEQIPLVQGRGLQIIFDPTVDCSP